MTCQKLGIFGGTFNPVHRGHLIVAETALKQFGLDQVLWVPTYWPAHKSNTELVEFTHRLTMVNGAIADYPYFSIPKIASDQQDRSYAISTLLNLQEIYAPAAWHWIIGIDSFQTLPQWRHSVEIAPQCTWLVAPRYQRDLTEICLQVERQFADQSISLCWHLLSMPQVNVSSSLVRSYCRMGRSLQSLVPDSVRKYINTHQLYQNAPSPPR